MRGKRKHTEPPLDSRNTLRGVRRGSPTGAVKVAGSAVLWVGILYGATGFQGLFEVVAEFGVAASQHAGGLFGFGPNSRAQANARSRNAEAMTRALRSMGYDAMDYCQMD